MDAMVLTGLNLLKSLQMPDRSEPSRFLARKPKGWILDMRIMAKTRAIIKPKITVKADKITVQSKPLMNMSLKARAFSKP
jgi:hypothetical protein